jgi:hypothetical protein
MVQLWWWEHAEGLRKFRTIIVWHCANHRLELSFHDAVKNSKRSQPIQT